MFSQIFGVNRAPAAQQVQQPAAQAADKSGTEYLSKFSSGQTVEGKITSIKGNDVQIELPGGGQVSARLDNAMALQPGQTLTFEVRSNSASQISLTPLYTNLTMDPTAAKALAAAGMAVNADTLAMTGAMMEGGMNIDKNSLGNMFRTISDFPGQDIPNMVEMTRMGLPVNESTIEQYGAFKNYENQISEGMQEVAEQALALYEELAGDSGSPEAMQFMRQLTDIFAKELPGQTAADLSGGQMGVDPAAGRMVLQMEEAVSEETLKDLTTLLGKAAEEMPEEKTAAQVPGKEAAALLRDAGADGGLQTQEGADKTAAQQVKDAILQIAKQAGADPALGARLEQTAATDTQVLKLANAVLKAADAHGGRFADPALKAQITDLFSTPAFKEVVKGAMKDNWSLRPEQVGDKANVENLFQKLTQQSKELTQMLQTIAAPESGLAQSLGNMSNNLDFMNQMNQMMQYVQLPLKMNGSEATGDLYVYSDKKSLARNDGNVSAMLHLDMQYLGTVDVFTAISPGNQVHTKFYMGNDAAMDLIEAHIDELNERLAQRGYHTRAEVTTHSDMDAAAGKLRSLKPAAAGSKPVLKQSFDVRA